MTVKLKDRYKVEIKQIGNKNGDGVARIKQTENDPKPFVVFIPGSELNKRYEIEITNVKETYAFARIIREIPKSDFLE